MPRPLLPKPGPVSVRHFPGVRPGVGHQGTHVAEEKGLQTDLAQPPTVNIPLRTELACTSHTTQLILMSTSPLADLTLHF